MKSEDGGGQTKKNIDNFPPQSEKVLTAPPTPNAWQAEEHRSLFQVRLITPYDALNETKWSEESA